MRIGRSSRVAPLMIVAALVASCSFSSKTPGDVYGAAVKDTLAASSVHIAGRTSSSGVAVKVDVRVDDKGDCVADLDYMPGRVQVIGVGGHYWYRADAAYYRKDAGAKAATIIKEIGTKFLAVTSVSRAVTQVCDLDSYFHTKDASHVSGTNKGTSTVDGVKVVRIVHRDSTGDVSTILVRADSPHYIVGLTGYDIDDGFTRDGLRFDDYGDPVHASAPSAAQIFTP